MALVFFFLWSCKNAHSPSDQVELTGDPTIDALTEAIHASPQDIDLYLQRSEIYYEREAYEQAGT